MVLSDEILIQFGKEVVYNTFDQNRIFIGIKQTISSKLSFDFGYMNVYQQKFSDEDGRIRATIELAWATAWAPHESQQKPLQPGSAKFRLADALKVPETKLN